MLRLPWEMETTFVSDIEGDCAICGRSEPPAEEAWTRKSLVRCCECGVCVHPSCFKPPLALTKRHYEGWRCAACARCKGCERKIAGETLLFCEKCGQSYHTRCTEQTVRLRKRTINSDPKTSAASSTGKEEKKDAGEQASEQRPSTRHPPPLPPPVRCMRAMCTSSAPSAATCHR